MDYFPRKLITEWRRLALPEREFDCVIAVSGGADSIALLFAIGDLVNRKKLSSKFIVAHFNHGLRGQESDDDQRFVGECADKLGLHFVTEKTNLQNLRALDSNLEQAARIARYKFLERIGNENSCHGILTAHTENDQAELFLMNLVRGSGVTGLGGMRGRRELTEFGGRIELIRPLLQWAKRTDTEDYASRCGGYKTDAMNSDDEFLRVKIRSKLIPILAEINPQIVDSLCKTASDFRSMGDELAKSAREKLAKGGEICVLQSSFREETTAIRLAMIREWLRQNRGNLRGITRKHLYAIDTLAFSPKSGRIAELPGTEYIEKKNGDLRFVRSMNAAWALDNDKGDQGSV